MENKCIGCGERKNCRDSVASWTFFIVGIVATLAVRVVTVLMHLNPLYAKIAWYVGVGGFFIFFVYKFKVGHARAKRIRSRDITGKVGRKERLAEEDYKVIGEILCALSSRKESVNYVFIFTLSAIALLLAVYMDFIQ